MGDDGDMSADDDTVGKPSWRLLLAAAGDRVGAAGATGVLTTASLLEPKRADTAPFCGSHQGGMIRPMPAQLRFAALTSQPWGTL
jgi:hypothetical protein